MSERPKYSTNPHLNEFLEHFNDGDPSYAPDKKRMEELAAKNISHFDNYQTKGGRTPLPAGERGKKAQKIARYRARIYSELKTIRPEMVNSAHYDSVRRRHRDFAVFDVAAKDEELRTLVSNIQYGLGALADKVTARKFGCAQSTVRTYCRDHKPRKP